MRRRPEPALPRRRRPPDPSSAGAGRELTRRELVRALTVLAASAALPSLAGCAAPTPRHLADLLPAAEAAEAASLLGESYRAATAAESNVEALADAILADLGWPARRLRGRDLAERLLAQVRHDHADGRVVTLEGWTFARTEARLFALRSLVR